VYGKTPFADLGLIQKLHCIVDDKYEVPFPASPAADPTVLGVIRLCLQRDPTQRPPIAGCSSSLLEHAYLRGGAAAAASAPTQRPPDATAASKTWDVLEAVVGVLDRELEPIMSLGGTRRVAALYQVGRGVWNVGELGLVCMFVV
jgi:hypothetical protein